MPRGVAEKAYAQMPIEEIDEKKYLEMKANIDENFSIASENIRLRDNEMIIEKFCDGDSCIR